MDTDQGILVYYRLAEATQGAVVRVMTAKAQVEQVNYLF
jgi:hypothetical protein